MASSGKQLRQPVATASAWRKRTRLGVFRGTWLTWDYQASTWGRDKAADTHVGGNGNSPPTRTLGRTTDASTDGVAADVRMEWHAGEA